MEYVFYMITGLHFLDVLLSFNYASISIALLFYDSSIYIHTFTLRTIYILINSLKPSLLPRLFYRLAICSICYKLYNLMEQDYFRKKVYMNTLSSTLIRHQPTLLPQWVSETQINYLSAYEFSSYNVQEEATQIIPRQQGQSDVLAFEFKPEVNQSNSEVYYACKEQDSFYLRQLTSTKEQKVLLYRNDSRHRQYKVYDFLDYLMMSQGEQQLQSSRSIASRTQKLIDQIKKEEEDQCLEKTIDQMSSIKHVFIALGSSYAVLVVEMKSKAGLMLVNISKCRREKQSDFICPIRPMSLRKTMPQLSQEQMQSARIIYLFSDRVISLQKTKDVTQFVLLTERNLLLLKINYELMQVTVLYKLSLSKQYKIVDIGVVTSRSEEHIMLLTNVGEKGPKTGLPGFLRLFVIEGKKINQIRQCRQSMEGPRNMIDCRIRFQDELMDSERNLVLSSKAVQSSNEIEVEEEEKEDHFTDFCGGVLMAVVNKMLKQENVHQDPTHKRQKKPKQSFQNKQSLSRLSASAYLGTLTWENIGGFICSQDLVIFWEKRQPIIHVYKLYSRKEQEENHRNQKEDQFSNQSLREQKQKQIKDFYSQLMGLALEDKENVAIKFEPRIRYLTRIDLGLIQQSIWNLVISPSNANILVISGTQSRQTVQYSIFQLDLFRQMGNQDPAIFIKPIKNIHKPKPVQLITTSLIKEATLFLSGKLIHNLNNQLLDGVLSFDIHPYDLFIAVSFGFSTKIYTLQGNDKLTSLYTINGQGMKQVKYSPLGNHLCILTSKVIKILDAYSFSTNFVLNQKISNFMKCFFSSNGLQFYTVSESHLIQIHNTFDYSKIDTIKPLRHTNDFKPIAIKSYLKIAQYCLVLQNGGLYVRYKSQAVVISQQQSFAYQDGQKIMCIEIDQKNGVLFVGCNTGKVRAHVWPLKEESAFEYFSEARASFCPISSLRLSNTSPLLYIGSQNGNISKLKYSIDRDKGVSTEKEHNLLLTDRNFRYFSMQGPSYVERMYRFVLINTAIVSTDEGPQKAKLQFKLSEVILKLNQQMKKLKINIRQQLQEKSKLSLQKVDYGLLHHMNQMISTKLYKQLKEEIQHNRKHVNEMSQQCQKQLFEIIQLQNQLIKEKSFKTYDFTKERNDLKQKFAIQLQTLKKEKQAQAKVLEEKSKYACKMSQEGQEQTFFMPNDPIQEYEEYKRQLQAELVSEKKKHYNLRKACAYKQTAIKEMYSKKIKEETLQFKIGLEKSEMEKKLDYNHGILQELKVKIDESQQKVHQIQAQAFVIKNNAQYKKIAKVEQMIDACSYNLWMKNKLEEQIVEFINYSKAIDELMESKCEEVIDLLAQKKTRTDKLKEVDDYMIRRKKKLHQIKLHLLTSRNRVKQLDVMQLFEEVKKGEKQICKVQRKTAKFGQQLTERELKRAQSSRNMLRMKQEVPAYQKLIDKETNFLKTNIKIHQRKMKKIGKENGRLLFEYQKLQIQRKNLMERQMTATNSLQKVKDLQLIQTTKRQVQTSSRPKLELSKTSFQKYIELKSHRSKMTPKYKTASSTPGHLATPSSFEYSDFIIQQ